GPNNSLLDNCHVRVSFSTNDERTAKRVSDALGTATELRAMKNYAGHRLAPWLGHLMISRQETARPLLTPGEVMQLPPTDEIVMAAGVPPIRAKKARYYEDIRFTERILPPPVIHTVTSGSPNDWSALAIPPRPDLDPGSRSTSNAGDDEDPTESEKRRQHELSSKIGALPDPQIVDEFNPDRDTDEHPAVLARTLDRAMQRVARQADLDPGDGLL
ncbi:MAG: type IV secretory system conjugative DNA transfer family protein, partial [Devosia sp.]